MVLRAGILVVLVVALLSYLIYTQHRHEPLKVSGFVEADEIRVGSRVGGRIAKTIAVEGAPIKSGDLLIELEPYDVFARQAQAQAQLTTATASAELAKLTLERIQSSFNANASSASEVDQAKSAIEKRHRAGKPSQGGARSDCRTDQGAENRLAMRWRRRSRRPAARRPGFAECAGALAFGHEPFVDSRLRAGESSGRFRSARRCRSRWIAFRIENSAAT